VIQEFYRWGDGTGSRVIFAPFGTVSDVYPHRSSSGDDRAAVREDTNAFPVGYPILAVAMVVPREEKVDDPACGTRGDGRDRPTGRPQVGAVSTARLRVGAPRRPSALAGWRRRTRR
jgi:hypothetical protein